MRKTKKTKQSPRVAKAVSKRLKPVAAAPSVPAAAPISFDNLFPVNIQKTDTTADTASLAPEPHQDTGFPGSKAA
jgi:hypothetical protein